MLDPQSFRCTLLAGRASAPWLVAAVTMVPQAAAEIRLGGDQPLVRAASGDAIPVPRMARGWIAVAICARDGGRPTAHGALGVACGVADPSSVDRGDRGSGDGWQYRQGPDHDYSTSAVIIFALALATLVRCESRGDRRSTHRGAAAASAARRSDLRRGRFA